LWWNKSNHSFPFILSFFAQCQSILSWLSVPVSSWLNVLSLLSSMPFHFLAQMSFLFLSQWSRPYNNYPPKQLGWLDSSVNWALSCSFFAHLSFGCMFLRFQIIFLRSVVVISLLWVVLVLLSSRPSAIDHLCLRSLSSFFALKRQPAAVLGTCPWFLALCPGSLSFSLPQAVLMWLG